MSELQVHANEVRNCRDCLARIVWLENAWKRRTAYHVPDTEQGKTWLSLSDKHRHDCPRKDRLIALRSKTKR